MMSGQLKTGDPAPAFELDDEKGKTWRLADLAGEKVILYFYPIDETPGCTAQARDFRDSMSSFTTSGYQVLGVSPQDTDSHERFSANHSLNFPLLVDEGGRVAQAYGVWQELKGGNKGNYRSTFVIDENGNLSYVEYGVKAQGSVGRLKETLGV
jgi:peroxiredoxin Q/BCP